MKFLDGLTDNLKQTLLEQLRILWTHTSTAIEGNTLSLGETAFVLGEGLTIGGKPLKDHRDVEGHALAVDMMFNLIKKDVITAADLFDMHKLVISERVMDAYRPIGDWKNDNNYTTYIKDNKLMTLEYSRYWEVPELMKRWLELLNNKIQAVANEQDIVDAYATLHISFVSIHPFWDGNGRIARLISNLPCLKLGYPPIVIENEKRYEYFNLLSDYTSNSGVPTLQSKLISKNQYFDNFRLFCCENWKATLDLVEKAHALQRNRDEQEHKKEHQ